MAYADLATIQTTDPGDPLTAAWCDQARDNEEFLIDPPACSVYRNAVQVVATSSSEVLLANSEIFDNASMHSTSSNTGRITMTTAGRYMMFGRVRFEADADGSRRIDIRKNGATSTTIFNIPAGSAVSDVVVTFATSVVAALSDYWEVVVVHTAGNDIDVTLEEWGATFLTRA